MPQDREIFIKKIQSYHSEKEDVSSNVRIALNVNNKKQDFKRGSLLVKNKEDFFHSFSYLIELSEQYQKIKNHSEVNIYLGSFSLKVLIFHERDNIYYIKSLEKISSYFSQNGVIISQGQSRLIAGFKILFNRKFKKEEWDKYQIFNENNPLMLRNYSHKIPFLLSVEGFIENYSGDVLESSKKIANFLFSKSYLEEKEKEILALLEQHKHGLNLQEVSNHVSFPPSQLKKFLYDLVLKSKIKIINEFYKLNQEMALNTKEKKLMKLSYKESLEALELKEVKEQKLEKELKDLQKENLIISLEDNLYYHYEIFDTIKHKLLQDLQVNDEFSIKEAREKLGLSRKYIIPILNKLEIQKFLKRNENMRIVIKGVNDE